MPWEKLTTEQQVVIQSVAKPIRENIGALVKLVKQCGLINIALNREGANAVVALLNSEDLIPNETNRDGAVAMTRAEVELAFAYLGKLIDQNNFPDEVVGLGVKALGIINI